MNKKQSIPPDAKPVTKSGDAKVSVLLRPSVLKALKAAANRERRSLSAQSALLIERGLASQAA